VALTAPVIFIPGITATVLRDEYPVKPDTVWSAMIAKDYDRIMMHPDNLRYEAKEPARVKADSIFDLTYRELIDELRYNLSERADEPVPVFPFIYDWRMPLEAVEEQLAVFVTEVIERTKLLKHYYQAGYHQNPTVNLVGHSMGGLLITGYLERYKNKAPISKVITIGTPYKGSYEAILKLSTGTADLGMSQPSSREREAARVTPSLYYLLPTCGGIHVDDGLSQDVFTKEFWQSSILQTMKEFVRLHGVGVMDPAKQAEEIFTSLLQNAKQNRARLEQFQLKHAGLKETDWLCIVGADQVTRCGMSVEKSANGPTFVLKSSDRLNNWQSDHPEERILTGDGTVPFLAALPNFIRQERVVCVTPDDFGYWETSNRVLNSVVNLHSMLANMNLVHRLSARFLSGRTDDRGNTWGRRVPGVKKWNPPMALQEKE